MGKFKIDEWVYTYDEQGLVYKHQVRGNVGVFYILTGKSEPINTQYIFKTKKECLKAMKGAGIQKASLHMATVIKLENKIADLEAKLAESEKELNRYAELFGMKDKDFYVVEKSEYEKMKQGAKEIVAQLKQQLTNKEKEVEELKKGVYKVTLGTTPSNQIDFTENFYIIQNQTAIAELEKAKDKISYYLLKFDYFTPKQLTQVEKMIKAIDQQINDLRSK